MKTGTLFAFCDAQCLKTFKKSGRPPWNPHEVLDYDPKYHKWDACLYCRMCGLLVYEPTECRLHEDIGCPAYSFWESFVAHAFAVQFLLRTGRRRVPDLLMDQGEELALMHPEMDAEEMAQTVIDRL